MVEAAIAWLVETILATLQIDKLDAWIRQVGLAEDIQKLKSEIKRVKIVVSTAKQRGIGNELLAEPLALLHDHIYEADDVVDELDYYRLQQQVEGGKRNILLGIWKERTTVFFCSMIRDSFWHSYNARARRYACSRASR